MSNEYIVTNIREDETKCGDVETVRREAEFVGPASFSGNVITSVSTSPIESATRQREYRGERREYKLEFELSSPVPFKYSGRDLDKAIRAAVVRAVSELEPGIDFGPNEIPTEQKP